MQFGWCACVLSGWCVDSFCDQRNSSRGLLISLFSGVLMACCQRGGDWSIACPSTHVHASTAPPDPSPFFPDNKTLPPPVVRPSASSPSRLSACPQSNCLSVHCQTVGLSTVSLSAVRVWPVRCQSVACPLSDCRPVRCQTVGLSAVRLCQQLCGTGGWKSQAVGEERVWNAVSGQRRTAALHYSGSAPPNSLCPRLALCRINQWSGSHHPRAVIVNANRQVSNCV